MIANKYRWAEHWFDDIFRLTVALTNVHIRWHPLRDSDGKTYERYLKRLNDIALTGINKRKRAQASYRKRRKRAIERTLRTREEQEGAGALFDDEEEDFSS